MSLVDLHYNQKKAQLEAERASTQKSVEGRQVLPGVMAQLAELRAKEQAQKEKISRQGESQGPSPQSMMPPMVEVSGQTSGRSPTQALKSASEIAQFVSGGAGIKQGMIGTIAGQQAPQQAPQQAGATQSVPTNIGQPTQTVPSGSQLIPQTVQLSGLERAASGVGAVLGVASRSPQAAVSGATELFKGERVVGYTTVDEQAQKFVPGLSVLEARRRDSDPNVSVPSAKLYDERMAQLRQMNPAIADSAASQALDVYYVKDEEMRLQRETPIETVKREKAQAEWAIEEQVIEHGPDSLNAGQRAVWEKGRRQTNTTNVINMPNPLQKSTRGYMEQELDKGFQAIQHMDGIDSAMPGMDWAFTLEGKADIIRLRDFKAKSPMLFGAMSPEQQRKINDYARLEGSIASFNLPEIHDLFGAAFTQVEMEAKEDLFPSMEKDMYTNKQDLKRLREDYGLALFRRAMVLDQNTEIDPRDAMGLGASKMRAQASGLERLAELQSAGKNDVDALNQVRHEFKSRFGIDWDYLNGVHH